MGSPRARSYMEAAKRGQMLVIVMMMLTTIIIMFGMTVSIGHLVQSKINLQNSVDLAVMSATSYQARHMNGLSIINYRIRQVLLRSGRMQKPAVIGYVREQVGAAEDEPIDQLA